MFGAVGTKPRNLLKTGTMVAGALVIMSGQAWAISSGCSSLQNSPSSATQLGVGPYLTNTYNLEAGEVIKLSATFGDGNVRLSVDGNLSSVINHGGTASAVSASVTVVNTGSQVVQATSTSTGPGVAPDAVLTITCTSSASATKAALSNLVASVSRSQTSVVSQNVGTRLASASVGVGGNSDQETASNAFTSTYNLSSTDNWEDMEYTSRKGSLRDLAMMASFDSSQKVLSAAGDENDPLKGTKQRQSIAGGSAYTVWGHGSYTSVDNNRNRTGDDSRYDGDVWGYNIGVDYRYRPELVAGLSLGYSETDLTTTFNNGTYDETTWTLSPYIMYQPQQDVTLSMVAGYSIGDIDNVRDSTVTGSTDSSMWFASVNGSYKIRPAEEMPLDLTAKVGFLLARKTVDAYTESDNTAVEKSISNTRQLKPGIEAGYSFDANGTSIQPFAKADYVHDFTDATNGDSGAVNIGGGLRVASSATGLSGTLEGEKQYGRSDYSEHTISGLIAYSFAVGQGENKSGFAEPYVKTNFTKDGQVYGTGMKFTSDSGAMSANFDITQTAPSNGGDDSVMAKIGAELKF